MLDVAKKTLGEKVNVGGITLDLKKIQETLLSRIQSSVSSNGANFINKPQQRLSAYIKSTPTCDDSRPTSEI